MNKLDRDYLYLCENVLNTGNEKVTRNGKTLSVFGTSIRHNMSDGFPLLTTKKMSIGNIATELIWFLNGDTNIKYLNENGCKIWNGDAYKKYHQSFSETEMLSEADFVSKVMSDKSFAEEWGDLGPIYGKQWSDWVVNDGSNGFERFSINQIDQVINDLKNNPDSRRILVSAWNVGELDLMTLPPCHYSFQFYTRELSLKERCEIYFKTYPTWVLIPEHGFFDGHNIPKRSISLLWNQRSVDIPLGLPYNIASYGLLLSIIAAEVNMVPETLIGNFGDTHIYENQVDGMEVQIKRIDDRFELPTLSIDIKENYKDYKSEDFTLEGYQHHPFIKFPLSN